MSWMPDLPAAEVPIYRALADAIAADVANGRLRPGTRLPPQRALAAALGIDLTTVTRAYAEAAAAGLTVSEGRRGTFVRARHRADPDQPAEEVASGMNMPPEPESGALRARLCEGVVALMKAPAAPLHYQPAGGTEAQRESAAAFLGSFIPSTRPDQLAIAAGSQHALHAILSLLLAPGDRIASGCFTYPGFLAIARRLGACVVPLAMDGDGIRPDSLEVAARAGSLKALYVIPTNDNPTAATLPLKRRREIAALSARFGFAIVEDDAYGRLPEQALAPIATLAPARSWHLTTMSKLLSPALRIGFVRAPSVADALALAGALHESAGMAPPINATLVARWLDDGSFLRLLRDVRAESRARVEQCAPLLAPLGARWHAEGYHLWLPLADALSARRIAADAVAAGLPAVPGAAFAVETGEEVHALRISLGGSASRARVRREVERLAALIGQGGRHRGALV